MVLQLGMIKVNQEALALHRPVIDALHRAVIEEHYIVETDVTMQYT